MFQFTGFPLHTYSACAYSVYSDGGFLRRVSPFRHLRINGYLLLPAAFRSLSRLSSALGAKASSLRSFQLNLLHKLCSSIRCDRRAFGSLLPQSLAITADDVSEANITEGTSVPGVLPSSHSFRCVLSLVLLTCFGIALPHRSAFLKNCFVSIPLISDRDGLGCLFSYLVAKDSLPSLLD